MDICTRAQQAIALAVAKLKRSLRQSAVNVETRLIGRIGFHTLWTKPKDGRVEMSEFEILTLVVSALSWKKINGPMCLYTDKAGHEWFKQNGLLVLYDDVRVILDDVPAAINPKVFWAAGKVYAYSKCDAPCVSLDLDSIVWKPLPYYMDDVVALHPEPTTFGGNSHHYAQMHKAFPPEEWNWHIPSANVGVLAFNDERLKRYYTQVSMNFMITSSLMGEFAQPYSGLFSSDSMTHVDEMIFAEQRLLTMCAHKIGRSVGFITSFDVRCDHIELNPLVSHLWNSKRGYLAHDRSRDHYCNFLLNHMLEHYPGALRIVRRMGIAKYIVRDANVPAWRFSKEGEWPLPGETMTKL